MNFDWHERLHRAQKQAQLFFFLLQITYLQPKPSDNLGGVFLLFRQKTAAAGDIFPLRLRFSHVD